MGHVVDGSVPALCFTAGHMSASILEGGTLEEAKAGGLSVVNSEETK
jgi:hypothetical protein